jgi:hypothetical protein
MPPLNYFVVESPDEVGRAAYERIAADVLQDLDLIKVVDRLHIYVDPKVPIFVAAGLLRHMPRAIRVADFANVNRGETEVVLDIGDETYLAPLLQKLWILYGKENVDQPDRFTVVLPAGRNSSSWWWLIRARRCIRTSSMRSSILLPRGSRSAASISAMRSFTMWQARIPCRATSWRRWSRQSSRKWG